MRFYVDLTKFPKSVFHLMFLKVEKNCRSIRINFKNRFWCKNTISAVPSDPRVLNVFETLKKPVLIRLNEFSNCKITLKQLLLKIDRTTAPLPIAYRVKRVGVTGRYHRCLRKKRSCKFLVTSFLFSEAFVLHLPISSTHFTLSSSEQTLNFPFFLYQNRLY